MKPILVLGSDRDGAPALERRRVDVNRGALTAEMVANAASYSSVIVVNDGGADTVRRLLLALRLHHHRQRVCIGILSYLDEAVRQELMARALLAPGPGPLAPADPLHTALLDIEPRLSVKVKEDVISFEYQAR